jgi:hypothetical protein
MTNAQRDNNSLSWAQLLLQQVTLTISTLRKNKRWSITSSSYKSKSTPAETSFDLYSSVSSQYQLGLRALANFNAASANLRYRFQVLILLLSKKS